VPNDEFLARLDVLLAVKIKKNGWVILGKLKIAGSFCENLKNHGSLWEN
jgi:hypothetical protein